MSVALSSEIFWLALSLPGQTHKGDEELWANQRRGTILWPISDVGWLATSYEIVPAYAHSAWLMSGPGTERLSLC